MEKRLSFFRVEFLQTTPRLHPQGLPIFRELHMLGVAMRDAFPDIDLLPKPKG